jgi:hypothetical protein
MRYLILFFITCLIVRGLPAQAQVYSLSGSVTDSITAKPLAAVSVFLNGTSKGTTTQDNGAFLLTGIPAGSYLLVVSAVGYANFQLVVINTNLLPSNLAISLHPRASELAAVTVKPNDQNGWNKWGGTFWDNFIGTTDNSNSCTIENKEVLRFHYNRKTRRLGVTAAAPLIIVNQALGYTIEYRLDAFHYDFSNGEVGYYGFLFFREMTPGYVGQERVWESSRQRAYFGSVRHFMRSLYRGRLKQEGFLILHQVKSPNTEKARVKAIYNRSVDSLRYYRKVLSEPDTFIRTINNYDTLVTDNKDGTRSFYFTGVFIVAYPHGMPGIPNPSSSMELTYPVSLQLEENGSYSPLQNLLLKGAWAKNEMVANVLPSDYYPPPN